MKKLNIIVTVETLKNLKNDDGLTLKSYAAIMYSSGYQVAVEGVECTTAEEAYEAIINYNGTCGIWYSNGIYYIDKSYRISTKKEALRIGKMYNQISVLCWKTMRLAYC